MKPARTKDKGITLTELLVASVMIGVVMMGVASFAVAIKNLHRSTDKTVIISLRTKAAMARITGDATLAVGHEGNRGIIPFSGGTHLSICFRHDTNNIPGDYLDNIDGWECYYRNSANNDLMICGGPRLLAGVPVTTDVGGAQACATGVVGDEFILALDPADNVFYTIVETGGRLDFVDITLSTIFDDARAFHDVNNPRYSTNTQVVPFGHSH